MKLAQYRSRNGVLLISRRGMSLVEVIVVITILGLLAAILLPATQRVREKSRQMECASQLRQIGVAFSNYHSTFNCFPPISGHVHSRPKSIWANLLPELGLAELAAYDRLLGTDSHVEDPSSELKYPTPLMRCPSDACPITIGSNYGVNLAGDGIRHFPEPEAKEEPLQGIGVFTTGSSYSVITDGTSNTAIASEFLRGAGSPSLPLGVRPADTTRPKSLIFNLIPGATTNSEIDELSQRCRSSDPAKSPVISDTRGQMWLSGNQRDYTYSHFDTPNGSSCEDLDTRRAKIYSASSQHSGGVNILIADGAVRFSGNDIDLKIWRSLGTRAMGD